MISGFFYLKQIVIKGPVSRKSKQNGRVYDFGITTSFARGYTLSIGASFLQWHYFTSSLSYNIFIIQSSSFNGRCNSSAYQDVYRYQSVYDQDSKDEQLSESLNEFVVMWLNNLIAQGYKIV